MIKFKCVTGQCAEKVFSFETDCVILGRGKDCTVCLDDDACSRHHSRIVETASGFTITDLESKNGIRVNHAGVKEASLVAGDRFAIGRHSFVFLGELTRQSAEEATQSLVENRLTIDSVAKLCSKVVSSDIDELRRVHEMMQAAHLLSQEINATVDLEDLYSLIAESLFRNLDAAERVCLFLKRAERTSFELVRTVSKIKGLVHPVSRTLLQQIEQDRVSLIASDAAADARFATTESIVFSKLRSFMLVPLVARDHCLGAIYVENSSRPACFQAVDLELLTLLGTQAALAIENALLYEDQQSSFYETIRTLGNTLEAKDKYTHGHSARVAMFSLGIARELGFEGKKLEDLRVAAELHDIGKIAIPEAIIGKSGTLTAEEFEAIKKHPQLGVTILQPIRFLKSATPVILYHHERYGGGGYPEGLRGEQIPLEARIVGLADSFDAMTSQRAYNQPLPPDQALTKCRQAAGTAFDPRCVEALATYLAKEARQDLQMIPEAEDAAVAATPHGT